MVLLNYKPSKAVQKSKTGGNVGNGFLTVINSSKNGKRLEFRKDIAEKLGLTEFLNVVYTEDSAVFFSADTENEGVFRIKKSGERSVVYSGGLVAELSDFFDLDFTTNVCHTFTEGKFEKIEDFGKIALIISKKKVTNEEVIANV